MLIIFSLIISFFLVVLFTPLIIRCGKKYKILDRPNKRKLHAKPTVKIGGLSIYLSFIIGISFQIFFGNYLDKNTNFLFSYLGVSSTLIFLIGLIDDLYNISPFIRLIFQFLIASGSWYSGFKIENLNISFLGLDQIVFFNDFVSLFFTIFWITGLVNAFNWLDGIDGLAVGISLFVAIGMAFIANFSGNEIIVLPLILLIGTCFGFLLFNIRAGKVIMGDCGSNFLGFLLSIISIKVFSNNNEMINTSSFHFTSAILIFFIPLFDMLRTISIRLLNKSSPFLPDRNHLHHYFIDRGFTSIQTTLTLWSLSLISILLAFSVIN